MTTNEVKAYGLWFHLDSSTKEDTLVERSIIPTLWGFTVFIIVVVDIVVPWP